MTTLGRSSLAQTCSPALLLVEACAGAVGVAGGWGAGAASCAAPGGVAVLAMPQCCADQSGQFRKFVRIWEQESGIGVLLKVVLGRCL